MHAFGGGVFMENLGQINCNENVGLIASERLSATAGPLRQYLPQHLLIKALKRGNSGQLLSFGASASTRATRNDHPINRLETSWKFQTSGLCWYSYVSNKIVNTCTGGRKWRGRHPHHGIQQLHIRGAPRLRKRTRGAGLRRQQRWTTADRGHSGELQSGDFQRRLHLVGQR